MSYFSETSPPPGSGEVLYEVRGDVATVTINRPDFFNAYSTRALEEIAAAVRQASWNDAVTAVVLTGAGERAFCTGGDVKEYQREYTARPRDYWKYMGLFRSYIESILRCPKPVIARLNGIAVGGGNETQLACDFTIAGSHVYLSQVGTGVGSVAAGGSTQWLPLVVGDKRARQMLYVNERVPAAKALDWGLVNEVAPTVFRDGSPVASPTPEEIGQAQRRQGGYAIDLGPLDEAVARLVDRLRHTFPECLRYTKAQANFWKELAWNATIPHAQEWLSLHYMGREPWEGMTAFVEKRPVDFEGLRRRWAEGRSPEMVWGAPAATCPSCGAQGLPEEFEHCGRCGAALAVRQPAEPVEVA
jgi:enoyl-CoA hydratase/carnithine racemase